jgi:hypothetical protein
MGDAMNIVIAAFAQKYFQDVGAFERESATGR